MIIIICSNICGCTYTDDEEHGRRATDDTECCIIKEGKYL